MPLVFLCLCQKERKGGVTAKKLEVLLPERQHRQDISVLVNHLRDIYQTNGWLCIQSQRSPGIICTKEKSASVIPSERNAVRGIRTQNYTE